MEKRNKENILLYLLKLISQNDKAYVKKTVETYKIANSTVYNYLHEMERRGIIEKKEGEGCRYRLVSRKTLFSYNRVDNLEEDRLFYRDIAPLLSDVQDNVFRAWKYAFTEMMNNAIEHSDANKIFCLVEKNYIYTQIAIVDDGIGIFKNIRTYMKKEYDRELELSECVALLFAGKFTTAKEGHSGEGIFFTSHLMDIFVIFSENHIFSRDNFGDVLFDHKLQKDMIVTPSTTVIMRLSNTSKKTTQEVFSRFSDVDEGFFKTHIPIAHMFMNGSPVSRSEARRLCEIITNFKEVNLDFSNVDEVGQAFIHEIFVVWKERNPDVAIHIENANQNVQNLIARVMNTKS